MRGTGSQAFPAAPARSWNRRIRRFNRAILNPLMLAAADQLRGTYPAVVRHQGRRSDRNYRTPVVAQPVVGGFIIPLPYGADTDWCRNVRAGGHFTIERAGQTYEVGHPEVVEPGEALPLVPTRARQAWQRFRIKDFLWVQILSQDSAIRRR